MVRKCPMCRAPLPLPPETAELSLLERAMVSSSVPPSWAADHHAQTASAPTSPPDPETQQTFSAGRVGGPVEPPYLASSAWAEPLLRIYSEQERRRM
jgi:hypothetical protein